MFKHNFNKSLTGIFLMALLVLFISSKTVSADEYTYDDNGRITQVEHDDGSYTVYTYDDNGNLLSVKTVSSVSKDEQIINDNTHDNHGGNPSDENEKQPSEEKEQKSSEGKEQKPSEGKEQKPDDGKEQKTSVINEQTPTENSNQTTSDTEKSGEPEQRVDSNTSTGDIPLHIIIICFIISIIGIIRLGKKYV